MSREVENTYDYLNQHINDKEIMHVCLNNPTSWFCNDENFWQDRLYKRYGKHPKMETKTWKQFYLQIVYITDKYQQKQDRLSAAIKKGDSDLIQFFKSF